MKAHSGFKDTPNMTVDTSDRPAVDWYEARMIIPVRFKFSAAPLFGNYLGSRDSSKTPRSMVRPVRLLMNRLGLMRVVLMISGDLPMEMLSGSTNWNWRTSSNDYRSSTRTENASDSADSASCDPLSKAKVMN